MCQMGVQPTCVNPQVKRYEKVRIFKNEELWTLNFVICSTLWRKDHAIKVWACLVCFIAPLLFFMQDYVLCLFIVAKLSILHQFVSCMIKTVSWFLGICWHILTHVIKWQMDSMKTVISSNSFTVWTVLYTHHFWPSVSALV